MQGAEWFATAPGGLSRYFGELYAALRRRPDLEVSASAFGDPPAGGQSWGPAGGSTLRRVRASRREPPPADAIVDRHFCLYGRSAPGKRTGRGGLVVHFHGPWAAESAFTGDGLLSVAAKHRIERLRYAGADRIVVLSDFFRKRLIDDYRIDDRVIRVIPGGVSVDSFHALGEHRAAGGDGEPAERPVVLCVRRLEKRMGIDVLLQAWPGVLAARPDAQLVIVGSGSQDSVLRGLAELNGLRRSVTFTGRLSDAALAEQYRSAAVTVVPSMALEGFGLIALESLAAGRAPVVTDCGGLPETVRGLDPSLIIPAANPDALAARLAGALAGMVPAPMLCRRHAETFGWAEVARRHAELYAELAP
ncbi:MAG: glycosyltransferase family 4 protein [Mycobacteriaceae bacterium]|nr:glycosyltransferase family 4 protein [Mycobacteriaceae bacterium]